MAHLRSPDDNVTARFRQKPRGSLPQNVHPGEQPPEPGATSPISPSASEQRNRDEQRRQESEREPNVAPSRQNRADAPLFTSPRSGVAEAARDMRVQQHQHHAGITPIDHPGASPQQKPNDSGRSSRVPG